MRLSRDRDPGGGRVNGARGRTLHAMRRAGSAAVRRTTAVRRAGAGAAREAEAESVNIPNCARNSDASGTRAAVTVAGDPLAWTGRSRSNHARSCPEHTKEKKYHNAFFLSRVDTSRRMMTRRLLPPLSPASLTPRLVSPRLPPRRRCAGSRTPRRPRPDSPGAATPARPRPPARGSS